MSAHGDPLIGRVLRGYRVESVIEQSRDGAVYRGEQLAVGRKVALKVRSPGAARPLADFVAEARGAARLVHAHIVPVLDVVEEGDVIFYSMEYLAGGSLAARVRTAGPLPVPEVVRLLRESADALRSVARSGLVHGDVNPTHLLFTEHGLLKLLHVGFAASGSASVPLASLPFLAPETLDESRVDVRSDVYGLGASLYYALTGRLPFAAPSVDELAHAKRSSPGLSPGGPPWLDTLVACMTRPDPAARCQDFDEVLQVIDETAGADTGDSRRALEPARSGRAGGERTRFRWSRKSAAFAGAGVVALGFFLAFLILARASPNGARAPLAQVDRTRSAAAVPELDGRTAAPLPSENKEKAPLAWPGLSPAAERSAGERPADTEIERLRERWLASPPSSEELAAEIDRLERAYPDPEIRRRIRVLREELALVEKRRDAEATLDRLVEQELRSRRYVAALAILADASSAEIDAAVIFSLEESVRESAARELLSARSEARDLAREGKFADALGRIDDLAGRLPAGLHDEARELLRSLAIERDAFEEAALATARAEEAVRRHLARVDVEGARAVLDELSPAPALLAERRAAIQSDIDLFERAWNALLESWSAREGGGQVELSLLSDLSDLSAGATGPQPFRLREVILATPYEPMLLLEDAGRQRARVPLLDLSRAALTSALESNAVESDGGKSRAEFREGLGLVLEALSGPGRAWPLLVEDETVAPDRRGRHRGRLLRRGQAALETKVPELVARRDALRAEKVPFEAWEKLARDVVREWIHLAGPPYEGSLAERLRDLARELIADVWRRRGPETLFSGRARLRTGNRLQLTYDFSSEVQLADFEISPHEKSALSIEGGELVLRGECRLLAGNPFRESLEVTVGVTRHDERHSNINFAMWTHAGEWVTWRGEPKKEDPEEEVESSPSDYLVFGVGYRPDEKDEYFLWPGGSERVAFPCFAIIGGARGRSLHRVFATRRFECFWAESVNRRVRGPQAIVLSLTPRSFQWTVNRLQLHELARRSSPGLWRWLEMKDPTGSLSLLTNGDEIRIGSLVVETVLDPAWLEREIKRRAELEWTRYECFDAGGTAKK